MLNKHPVFMCSVFDLLYNFLLFTTFIFFTITCMRFTVFVRGEGTHVKEAPRISVFCVSFAIYVFTCHHFCFFVRGEGTHVKEAPRISVFCV